MKIKFNLIAPTIFLLTILITNYYLFNNRYFHVHDFTVGVRVFEQHQAIKDGQFPPRWSKNLGFGYGMPIFQFYAPLAYYIIQVLYLFNFSILASIKLTYILISIFAFIGSYKLAKKLTNKWGGLLSAVSFSMFAYHAVNIYVRGALAEFLAVSFFPWICYFSLQLLSQNNKKNCLFLTLSLTGLFLSHNISVISFLPFWAIFVLFYFIKNKDYKTIIPLIISFLNAILIASFFLFPAFIQKKYTRADTLTEGYSNYNHHFLYFRQLFIPNWGYGGSIAGIEDDISFYLGTEILIIISVTGLILIYNYFKNKRNKNNLISFLFFSFLFFISIFLTNYKSKIIWDNLPLISFIQFPWRFLGIATFFLSILISFSFTFKKNKNEYLNIFLIFLIIFLNAKFFQPEKLENQGEIYNPNEQFIKQEMSGIIPDYLPKDIDWKNVKPIFKSFQSNFDQAKIEVIKDATNNLTLKLNSEKDFNLTINRFTFPNWQIKLNGKKINCEIKEFIYHCKIPEGEHKLEFFWSEKGINQISNYLSVFGIISLFIIYKKYKDN